MTALFKGLIISCIILISYNITYMWMIKWWWYRGTLHLCHQFHDRSHGSSCFGSTFSADVLRPDLWLVGYGLDVLGSVNNAGGIRWLCPQLTGSWHQTWMERALCHSQGVLQRYNAMEWRFKQNSLPVTQCAVRKMSFIKLSPSTSLQQCRFGLARADVEQKASSVLFYSLNLLTTLAEIAQESHQGSCGRQLAHSQLQFPKEQIEICKVVSTSAGTTFFREC